MYALAELTALFREELKLCQVRAGERVVVVGQSESRPGYVEAALTAARSLGAHAFGVMLPGFRHAPLPRCQEVSVREVDHYLEQMPSLLEAFRGADLVIDVTAEGLVHTRARQAILGQGARMLMVAEPPEILERMFPRPSLRQRCERALQKLRQARTMRVRSEAGTDVLFQLADSMPVLAQYGYTDQPGRWDHWPGGFVACYPLQAEGRIVLNTGDILLPMNRYVDHPIEVHLQQGRITEIRGQGRDALLFRRYLEVWGDPNAFALSHVGFGLDETALWEALYVYEHQMPIIGQDARAFAGNFMWSTGPNVHVGRYTPAHYDIPMRECTILLDDQVVIERGEIVDPELAP
ncbi:2,5-dihydroxypyridine 5,6-dioxygenase [bacterium HR10]|nr:2,5-dihydroxypyridine 5,6-dioxygenase [bacterium HR10]